MKIGNALMKIGNAIAAILCWSSVTYDIIAQNITWLTGASFILFAVNLFFVLDKREGV